MLILRGAAPNRQLAYQAFIDPAHPLSAGLVCSALNSQADLRCGPLNYVTRARGTITAPSTTTFSNRGVCDSYNGSSSWSNVPVDLSPHKRLTISFWLYWDAYSTGTDRVMQYGNSLTTQTGFYVSPDSPVSSGSWLFGLHASGTYSQRLFARPNSHIAGWYFYAFHLDLTLATDQMAAAYVGWQNIVGTSQMPTSAPLTNNIQTLAANQTFSKRALGLFNDDTGSAAGFFGAGKMMNLNIYSRLLSVGELGSLMLNPYQMFVAPSLIRGLRGPTAAFNPAWASAANTMIQPGAMTA